MIVPFDEDFLESRLIKQGHSFLNSDFKPLVEWIDDTYSVNTLNIYYGVISGVHHRRFPRLSIIFEYQEDEWKFRDGVLGNFHHDKQEIVGDKFKELVIHGGTGPANYETKDLLVIFTSFAPSAMVEANLAIPDAEIDKLTAELNNVRIWKIHRCFGRTTFFFYTDKQAKTARSSVLIEQLTDRYFNILKKYDEFDYYDRATFSIDVDSKANFEKNFQGSWFYYDR